MPYNSNTHKITAPLNQADVQQALGINKTSWRGLCSDIYINPWARFKPVVKNLIDSMTNQWDFTNNRWLNSSTWWKGEAGNPCGITPPTAISPANAHDTLSGLIALYDGGMNGWAYIPPILAPARIIDFAGYNHDAVPPLSNFFVTSEIVQDGTFIASGFLAAPAEQGQPLTDYLTLADFELVDVRTEALYFGIVFVTDNNDDVITAITVTTAGGSMIEGDFGDVMNPPLSVNSYYQVYPILCNQQITLGSSLYSYGRKYWPLPMVNPYTIKCISHDQQINVTVSAEYNLLHPNQVLITITNNSSQAFTNCSIFFLPDSDFENPVISHHVGTRRDENGWNLTAYQVFNTAISGVPTSGYYVLVQFDGTTYSKSVYPKTGENNV